MDRLHRDDLGVMNTGANELGVESWLSAGNGERDSRYVGGGAGWFEGGATDYSPHLVDSLYDTMKTSASIATIIAGVSMLGLLRELHREGFRHLTMPLRSRAVTGRPAVLLGN